MTMADTIAVMNPGVIEQMGAPGDLYENPATTFVANFLGQSNLIMADVVDPGSDAVVVDCHGQKVGVHPGRSHIRGGKGWLSVIRLTSMIARRGQSGRSTVTRQEC